MKYISIFLLIGSLFSASTATTTLKPNEIRQDMGRVKTIEFQLASCRQMIEKFTQDNTRVVEQFDALAEIIKKAYLAGEGFIERDVYRMIDGIIFAAEKHRFQVRKTPECTPYIIHPMGVAHSLMETGRVHDPDVIIGALLHDTVEDTQTTFKEIELRFGVRVTDFIREVTDDKSLDKEMRKQLQIAHAPEKSAGAAQIKLADKLYNLTDLVKAPPPDWDVERIDLYFKWAKAVVDGLPWVNEPLKRAVDEVIETYWKNKK